MNKKLFALMIISILIFLPTNAMAVVVTWGTLTGFSGPNQTTEYACIRDAIKEWQDLFVRTDNDAHVITIDFVCDTSLLQNDPHGTNVGKCSTDYDSNGYPVSATITVDNDDLIWVLPSEQPYIDPEHPTSPDALYILKHEVGHAMGIDYKNKDSLWSRDVSLGLKWDPETYVDENNMVQFDWSHYYMSDSVMHSHADPGIRNEPLLSREGLAISRVYTNFKLQPEPATIISFLLGAMGFAVKRFWKK